MQSFLMPIRSENATPSNSSSNSGSGSNSNLDSNPNIYNDSDHALEMAENGGQPSENHGQQTSAERVQ